MSEASNSQKPVSLEGLGRNNNNLEKKFSKEFISKDKFGDPTAFSVPVSAWTASEDPDFQFAAEIADSTVTTNHIAHFDFDKASIIAAMEAVVITGDTSDGKITLLAEKVPTMALSGAYTITRKEATE